MKICTLSECLNYMHSGEAFALVWVTADKQRKRGGQILSVQNARLCTAQLYTGAKRGKGRGKRSLKQEAGNGHGGNSPKITKDKKADLIKLMDSKNPHHWENGTRNIILDNGKIRKVHIQLILEINGFKVLN